MNKKIFFPIIYVIMLFTLITPVLAGNGYSPLANASFDYWNGGTLDDWIVSGDINAYSDTSSNKVDGNASMFVDNANLNSEEIYQSAGGLSSSAMYTVSASVRDNLGSSHTKLCIDQTGTWNADETTCSSESSDTNSFVTMQVSASTDGAGNLGYIFFVFNEPSAFSTLNQKPTGTFIIIDIYIDNLVISPTVNEFSDTFPVIILFGSVFVIGILVHKKNRA